MLFFHFKIHRNCLSFIANSRSYVIMAAINLPGTIHSATRLNSLDHVQQISAKQNTLRRVFVYRIDYF